MSLDVNSFFIYTAVWVAVLKPKGLIQNALTFTFKLHKPKLTCQTAWILNNDQSAEQFTQAQLNSFIQKPKVFSYGLSIYRPYWSL